MLGYTTEWVDYPLRNFQLKNILELNLCVTPENICCTCLRQYASVTGIKLWQAGKLENFRLAQGFSSCGSRKKILGSLNKSAFCAFEIGFLTIILIDNQKLEQEKCYYTIVI